MEIDDPEELARIEEDRQFYSDLYKKEFGKRYKPVGKLGYIKYHGVIGLNGEEIWHPYDDGIPFDKRTQGSNGVPLDRGIESHGVRIRGYKRDVESVMEVLFGLGYINVELGLVGVSHLIDGRLGARNKESFRLNRRDSTVWIPYEQLREIKHENERLIFYNDMKEFGDLVA